MPFIANHNVSHNGRDYAPGEEVKFKDTEADTAARETLLDCKAIREEAGKAKADKAEPADKPLASMTKAELEAIVLAEVGTAVTNANKAELVAVIEAKRAQAAADAAAAGEGDGKSGDTTE